MQETQLLYLGWEDPLEEETTWCSNILAWRTQWIGERDKLQSMGSQRVRHHWACTHESNLTSLISRDSELFLKQNKNFFFFFKSRKKKRNVHRVTSNIHHICMLTCKFLPSLLYLVWTHHSFLSFLFFFYFGCSGSPLWYMGFSSCCMKS